MILVLGGTSDARALAAELQGAGHDVLLSVVSDYGARLAKGDGVEVRDGALDEGGLDRLLGDDVNAVVDATHPFAEEISALAAAACGRRRMPCLRYERPASELPEGALAADDAAAAAALAVDLAAAAATTGFTNGTTSGHPRGIQPRVEHQAGAHLDTVARYPGRYRATVSKQDPPPGHRPSGPEHGHDDPPATILLTVGAKTVATYAHVAQPAGVRLVARVLPTEESIAACTAAGLQPADIIAMQGPTSAELDAALLRHLGATVLVTKDSGDAGGLAEKLRAAELAGATAVVVRRPLAPVQPATAELPTTQSPAGPAATTGTEVLGWLAELGIAPAPSRRLSRGLLQVYTGDGKGKTTAAAGLALRARGAGLAVTFIQFVKGGRESAELAPLRAAGVDVVRPAAARSGILRGAPTPDDRAAAAAAWAAAQAALADARWDLVVLDELHAAVRHGLVEPGEVAAALASRPSHQEVVTTGRGAPADLIAAADLVTEMVVHRHPYPDVPARRGVEF